MDFSDFNKDKDNEVFLDTYYNQKQMKMNTKQEEQQIKLNGQIILNH